MLFKWTLSHYLHHLHLLVVDQLVFDLRVVEHLILDLLVVELLVLDLLVVEFLVLDLLVVELLVLNLFVVNHLPLLLFGSHLDLRVLNHFCSFLVSVQLFQLNLLIFGNGLQLVVGIQNKGLVGLGGNKRPILKGRVAAAFTVAVAGAAAGGVVAAQDEHQKKGCEKRA